MRHVRPSEAELPTPSDPPAQLGDELGTTPEEKVQRSLFGEILDWMLVPLLLLWPLSIAITYLVAKSIANIPFDRALDDRVTVLSQQVHVAGGRIVSGLTGPSREILRADDMDQVYFQVVGPDGRLIDGDPELPQPPVDEDARGTASGVQFRNATLNGTDLRIASMRLDLRAWSDDTRMPQTALVQVGETLEKRAHLANEIIKGVILPQFIILPIALALVWFALSRGLSPLAELQRHIRARRPDDLSPIDSGQVPEEITPLVTSLNDMLERLSQSIRMQKRFIADAAHQMKTPLAGMRMQSELALRETDRAEIQRSLEQLAKSSESATRLVNQLLALARAENQAPAAQSMGPLELSELARNVVQDWVQASFSHRIDLGFEQPGHPIMVTGNALMLREMLGNLIDNALHYTPAGGSVTVRVRSEYRIGGPRAILEVEDNGPGIPPAERAHVFERFYRILGSSAEGSGLGLAIVREIAQQHEADIEIADNPHCRDPKMPGTRVSVMLPLDEVPRYLEDIS